MLSLLKQAATAGPDAHGVFRTAYGAYFLPIRRYVGRLSGDPAQAEDIAQDVFVRLWKELKRAGAPTDIRAWLFRVASNRVVDRLRSQACAFRVLLPSDAVEGRSPMAAANVEREVAHRQTVAHVLKRLPEPMRQCLLLHHEGLTGKEIAEVVRVKPSYVPTLVFRAHERFRRECDALGGPDALLR